MNPCAVISGSKYRVYAAFAICRIYQEDLNDRPQAKTALDEFLKRYPHSQYGDQARAALKALQQPAAEPDKKGNLKEVSTRQTVDEEPVKPAEKPEKKNGKESEREPAPKSAGCPRARHPALVDTRLHAGGDLSGVPGRVPGGPGGESGPHLFRPAQHLNWPRD